MKPFLLVFLFFFSFVILSQSPELDWATFIGSNQIDQSFDINIDQSENVLTCGNVWGAVDFDPSDSKSYTLTPANNFIHSYVQKLNEKGEFIWAKIWGGDNDTWAQSLTTDDENNIYITGYFIGTVDLNPSPSESNYFTSVGWSDAYVLKLDSLGNFVWAFQFGGELEDEGVEIRVDKNFDIIISGDFSKNSDFDPSSNVYNVSGTDNYNSFILKIDKDHNFKWVKTYDTNNKGIAIDSGNNIISTGYFGQIVNFDNGYSNTSLTSNFGTADIYLLKISQNGDFLWVKSFGSDDQDLAGDVYVDQYDSILLTGSFRDTIDLDPSPSAVNNFISKGDFDVLIVLFNSNGEFQWAKTFGGTKRDVGEGICRDYKGNIYPVGRFDGVVNVDEGKSNYNIISNGLYDFYVIKLLENGNFEWAATFGGNQIGDYANEVTTSNDASVYVTGSYSGIIDLDPGLSTFNTLAYSPNHDNYIIKLKSCNSYSTSDTTVCDNYISPSGKSISQTLSFKDTIPNFIGCDSIISINLTVKQSTSSLIDTIVCNNYISPSGKFLNQSLLFNDTIPNLHGCDSIISINLTINDITSSSIDTIVCDNYVSPSGKNYNQSLIFNDTIQNKNGCDSVITIDLKVNQSTTSIIDTVVCDNYISPSGKSINQTIIFKDTIPNLYGCDSLITINLIVNNSSISFIDTTLCSTIYTSPSGKNYNQSGVFNDTIINTYGCDSVITIDLKINNSTNSFIDTTVCDSLITPSGKIYYTSMMFNDTIINSKGCDSIMLFNLTTNYSNYISLDTTICNQFVLNNGFTISEEGMFYDSLQSVFGCDSIISYLVTIPNSNSDLREDTTICKGDSIYLFHQDFQNYFWNNNYQNGAYVSLDSSEYIKLIPNNIDLCNSIDSFYVTVVETPLLNFITDSMMLTGENSTVNILNYIEGDTDYTWDFGDGEGELNSNEAKLTYTYLIDKYNDTVTHKIKLIGVNAYGCLDSISKSIKLYNFIKTFKERTPTGFSPNNDNINDFWYVRNPEDFEKIEIKIYDNWGLILFEGNKQNNKWDGKYKDKEVPDGNYYYIVVYDDEKIEEGVITLKR